ncbi:NADH-ubiquinone oxidoreductase-F iron-sulfur binding region domain-containing protein [Williamsia serinedens]|uniref:NADH:ubiquinone oxidoreductase, NADH-binding subunit (Chain F) n=1 Tax=Williamsia serinedens TaxID=391736 RepID=A0ABT1H060_9NOCA|nr:NADH-ubiquinone oxidoreductase-F iron-sulfur binding region domain-containing protein [Williamsia serinedens]MCP2160167.1 NADH:ubiquinone oxidoreductase, NADH-binding subunit (chain F) [Williamsia serinedens]
MTAAATSPTGMAPAPGGRRRLLLGVGDDIDRHARTHGPRRLHGPAVIDEIARSGLTGRGGAAFPVATKLATARDAMTRGRRSVVVANAAEGEPLSRKDAVLVHEAPHLVLDGLAAVASAVGATETYLYVPAGAATRLRAVIATRAARGWDHAVPTVVEAPDRFVAGETTAVVDRIAGGAGLPHDRRVPTAADGLRGRPTVVHNVETLAHVALVDRHGADWFRERGTRSEPGSMLVTVSDDGGIRGVAECDLGAPLASLVDPDARAVLVGGFHGTWVDGREVGSLALSARSLRAVGAAPGAGIVRSLGAGSCGLRATADIADHLAAESAGQCGPCVFGLPALASAIRDLVTHGGADRAEKVARLAATVDGRGACAHPDGTARLVRSALTVFADDIHHHAAGRCAARTSGGHR